MLPRLGSCWPFVVTLAVAITVASIARAADDPYVYTGLDPVPPVTTGELASPPRVPSWPATIGENFSSPMFYDLDGDGILEVITTDRQSTYVFAANGSLWPGWPRPGGSDNIPAVADVDEDGVPEIFITSPGAPPKLRCFHPDGTTQPGFPVNLPYQYWLNVSCPAIADVDGDGHLDVGAQSEPGVAFFDRFGQPLPGWPYLWSTTQNIVWSGPVVADLDGDGACEVVVGNNCLYNCSVHVIRSDGSAMPDWPQPTSNIFSSAAVGDLDQDGDLEIVIQEGDPTWWGNLLHVWHHDGRYVDGWPIEIAPQWESSRSNPALADLDGDGKLEIVTHTDDGLLHILDSRGQEWPGYPRQLPDGSIASVQVVDIDADATAEFFLCYYFGGSQWVSGWRLDGTTLAGFPKLLFANSQLAAHGSAHFADLEGDGDLDLCAQGGTFGTGSVRVYEVEGSQWSADATRVDWPKIRHDTRNTGYSPLPTTTAVAEATRLAARLCCFPNPVSRGSTLSLRLPVSRRERVSLYDLAGRRLGSIDVDGGNGVTVPTRSLFSGDPASGVYLLRVEEPGGAGGRGTRLVVVE
jgi:hypothetical protein